MSQTEGCIAVIGCNNCGKCDNICPYGALQRRDGKVSIDYSRCTVCMKCIKVCPVKALVYVD
ncbi:4Fe-4S dicluster domain-containing protein [Methanococcoides methylutens]|uniref:4Fe-4S dicluster domain-containing protein n=1 Tax=Methanococcoides methylutens TaxID=2226 RepID=UPI0009E05D08|nr:4Fe-4S binding protein [Methanococcoides methylutens]